MTSKSNSTANLNGYLEASLTEAAKKACILLKPNSLGVLVRKPLVDEDCPEVSDVDLISIWEKPEELPERITVQSKTGRVFVDILWIPVSKIFDPLEAASYKTLPHLLLEYENIWIQSDAIKTIIDNIKLTVFDKETWARRISHQINFGDAALEEAKKNLPFPPAALFFLQTAHSYYITALADCMKRSTMSLLNRPVTKLRRIAAETNPNLERLLRANLHIEKDPTDSLDALRRVYNNVVTKCAGRMPQGVAIRTRGHFAYTISSTELEYRESVARALIDRLDYANANYYLRFWAYSLSRCPIVLEEAREGRKPSFYVPFEPFKESVLATCPEILEDMKTILGKEITTLDAQEAIKGTTEFKNIIIDQIQARNIKLK